MFKVTEILNLFLLSNGNLLRYPFYSIVVLFTVNKDKYLEEEVKMNCGMGHSHVPRILHEHSIQDSPKSKLCHHLTFKRYKSIPADMELITSQYDSP